jgi:FkbM family methyltransferase
MIQRFQRFLSGQLKHGYWRRLMPECRLSSGIPLFIRSQSDWDIFSEIFVNGYYDQAILDALREAGSNGRIHVLDLGANVGFFTLRAVDLASQMGVAHRLSVRAFEGNPNTHRTLLANLQAASHTRAEVRAELGLIGHREGRGYIYSSMYSGANSVLKPSQKRSSISWRGAYAVQSDYIDLTPAMENLSSIDLIKCDIEGSEEGFLRCYPELLRATKRLVIECHPRLVDLAACRRLIEQSGFWCDRHITESPTCVVDYYVKTVKVHTAQ